MQSKKLLVDGRSYRVDIHRSVSQPFFAPRLAVVAFQPNHSAREILHVCLQTIQKFTPQPYELWVIDNHSPREFRDWLLDWPNINVILNHDEPFPFHLNYLWRRFTAILKGHSRHTYEASYANAVALEIALLTIEPQVEYFMSLHMDTMPCNSRWLDYLKSKIDQGYSAAGVRMDKNRNPAGILHVLGLLVNFQRFRSLKLNYLPKLPEYDVGDLVTVRLRQAGHPVFACRNTLWDKELEEMIPVKSPLKHFHVDRSFDDEDQILFLHLGRGVRKALGKHQRGVTWVEWLQFARENLIGPDAPSFK